MSSELEVVLLCARSRLGPDALARAGALLDTGVKPERLRSVARRHGLGPLLSILLRRALGGNEPTGRSPLATRPLRTAGLDRIVELARTSQEELRLSAVRGMLTSRDACEVSGWLSAAGVEVLVIKGPALSGLYPSGLRDCSDIDLLVKPEQVLEARAVLLARGYRQSSGPPEAFLSRCLTHGAELGLERRGRVAIDLHWRLSDAAYAFRLPDERIWERANTIELASGSIKTLGHSELLVYLCFHGAKHLWSRLLWLSDVARLVEAAPLDWDDVEALVRVTHTRRLVSLGLVLARDLLGCRLPSGAARLATTAPEVAHLAAEVRDRLEAGWTDLSRHRFLLRTRERRRDQLEYLFDMALRPSVDEWSLVTLPAPLFPLYSGLRMLRLAGRYGGLALRRRR